jgi:ribose transport system ATP-binding protein
VIGKWLLADARVLLLYDPTRGVDIKTKTEIYHLIRRFADDGGAVLFYSTDLEEIVNLCDRAMVCYRGRLSEPIPGEEADNEKLLSMVLGGRVKTETAA